MIKIDPVKKILGLKNIKPGDPYSYFCEYCGEYHDMRSHLGAAHMKLIGAGWKKHASAKEKKWKKLREQDNW